MKYQFARRFEDMQPSMIRSVLVRAAGPDMINFSPGFPDHDAFPIAALQRISDEIMHENPDLVLQYARAATFEPLKKALIPFFNRTEKIFKDGDDLTVTSGSAEGLEMATKVFLNPDEWMVAEDPTFVGALNGFKSNGARIIGVPMEADGMNLALLEKAFLHRPRPKMLYMIPTFQNPTTLTTSLAKRKAIYDLCVKYQVIILEDNPYGALRFQGEELPTMKSMDTEGIVVYFASLSKIISPGMRLGAIIANRDVIERFNTIKGASAGAATNWSQLVIARFFEQEDLNAHLQHLQEVYRQKSNLMYQTMVTHFHPDVKMTQPDGGMFIWFTLPDTADADLFLEEAIKAHIAIVPETTFAVDSSRRCQGFRLSFTSASLTQIETGIKKLGELTHLVCGTK